MWLATVWRERGENYEGRLATCTCRTPPKRLMREEPEHLSMYVSIFVMKVHCIRGEDLPY
jgi:hypothetical protein